MRWVKREDGISIVEVLAGFIILSIILISFFSILTQTKKTNAHSEKVQEVTFIAQAQMEAFYLIANDPVSTISQLKEPHLVLNPSTSTEITYNKQSQQYDNYEACKAVPIGQITNKIVYASTTPSFSSKLEIHLTCKSNKNIASRVLIEVIDNKMTSSKAQIESVYIWKES